MADTKISALTAASNLLSAVLPVVQGGGNKKASTALFQRGGSVLRVTSTGTTAVPAGTTAVIIKLVSAGSVTLTLPKTSDQAGIDIGIADWAGNATVTVTPDASDTGGVMGVAGSLSLGTSAAAGVGGALHITISPDTTLLGWYAC